MGIFTEVYAPLQSTIYGQTLRETRKLANNTYGTIHGSAGDYNRKITVRFHATNIVSVTFDSATYNTGGWFTFTTKDRINRYLPQGWRLWSEKNVWRVGRYRYSDDPKASNYVDISRFYDGITFVEDADGHVIVEHPESVDDDPTKAMRKAINNYAKLYTEEEMDRLRSLNTMGDCLYCQIEVEHPGFTDSDHLSSHVDEGYTMITLAYNALKFVGYRDPGFILTVDRGEMVRRAVRKYLTAKLVTSGEGALANAS